jgi:hypothetical protein
MSEEAIKRQRRELADAVFERFRPFGFRKESLSGDPFDIRIFRQGCAQEWLFRCIPSVSNKDKDVVRDDVRPTYCIKGVVFRPTPGSKQICFLEIE